MRRAGAPDARHVRGLLGPVCRKNGRRPAEYAGHATSDGLRHLLAGARWGAGEIRDELQDYVAERLGEGDGVLIADGTGSVRKGATSAGGQRRYSGTAGRIRGLPDRGPRGLRLRPQRGPGGPGSYRPVGTG
ncbi:hypothetical protein GCM10010430_04440 [Kitasatospora cystarginea]|uniref:Transposase IS701-like DDE domain-containing protein n=1 Tax=Kitasatospora cystarginea TaxID=58350 RepID=A0ABP5Q7F4_9ACTN